LTSDLHKRLAKHNAGKSPHTRKFTPWECVVAIWFADHAKAEAFEEYLKHGSGHAFGNRHFW
jgi:predicted GIY-YIG superfamily endonuclease